MISFIILEEGTGLNRRWSKKSIDIILLKYAWMYVYDIWYMDMIVYDIRIMDVNRYGT